MAHLSLSFLLALSLLAFTPFCLCGNYQGGYLYPQFYDHSCPKAQEIVKSIVAKAVAREARIAASLLRLHFHDCFVQVCFQYSCFLFRNVIGLKASCTTKYCEAVTDNNQTLDIFCRAVMRHYCWTAMGRS